MRGMTGAALAACWLLAGCGESATTSADQASAAPAAEAQVDTAADPVLCENHAPLGRALFGDVHVHTSFSFDAAARSTGATPVDANRYARGEPIPFFPIGVDGPTGTAQIDRPLDFLAATDHGEFLGETALCQTPGSPVFDGAFCTRARSDQRVGMAMFGTTITTETPERIAAVCGEDGSACRDFARSPWEFMQQAANEANEPCAFTSFVAYEYTGTPGTSNYHRNVIFRGDDVPALPVSYVDAPYDSALWEQLDAACLAEDGCDYLTIPHNSNLANGRMAPYMRLADTVEAKRDYAETRLAREPIMEIFQHKGGSECINGLASVLGAPDELCDIEQVRPLGGSKTYAGRDENGALLVGAITEAIEECDPDEIDENGMLGGGCVHATDFQRSALVVGLREEAEIGLNPIKLGIIAATDTHSATPGNVAEDGWTGAVTGESTPRARLMPGVLTSGIDGNPGGLAGVWAPENTRDAIFDAMLRREVFGTSGPRITVRLFGGWNYDAELCSDPQLVAAGYEGGVPMGGDLDPSGAGIGPPRFVALASKDPQGQDLQTLQLVKGWVGEDGSLHTEVVDVLDAPEGASTLCAVHEDADFDPMQPAYWYLRAVEPPVARWHTHDCAALAEARPEADLPAVCSNGAYPETVREMAWSSPIWFRPGA